MQQDDSNSFNSTPWDRTYFDRTTTTPVTLPTQALFDVPPAPTRTARPPNRRSHAENLPLRQILPAPPPRADFFSWHPHAFTNTAAFQPQGQLLRPAHLARPEFSIIPAHIRHQHAKHLAALRAHIENPSTHDLVRGAARLALRKISAELWSLRRRYVVGCHWLPRAWAWKQHLVRYLPVSVVYQRAEENLERLWGLVTAEERAWVELRICERQGRMVCVRRAQMGVVKKGQGVVEKKERVDFLKEEQMDYM